ncbi:hypothetical protein HDV00_002321 [Rhizophlyctis rosea]|nr:hypothetical protein HDV00_002321 [Rhizophlyctis rosea]
MDTVQGSNSGVSGPVVLSPHQNGNAPAPAPKKSKSSVLPPNALSITERFFYNSPPGKPQVIMTFVLRLQPPPQVPHLTITRIVDILRLSASSHHRLISYIDPKTQITHPLGKTAADFNLPYRVIKRSGPETWANAFRRELNTNFDISDITKPLWRVSIIAGGKVGGVEEEGDDGRTVVEGGEGVEGKEKDGEVEEGSVILTSSQGANFGNDLAFDVMFSFHHCLGDGLSMFAFARTFTALCDAKHFNAPDLHLENVLLDVNPPPIIDNLVNPYLIEVLPVAAGMAFRYLGGKRHARFKGRLGIPNFRDSLPAQHAQNPPQTPSLTSAGSGPIPDIPSVAIATSTIHGDPDPTLPNQLFPQFPPALSRPSSTNVRFLWFDESFTSQLRARSKAQGTTIAAVLVVNALAAVRSTYGAWAKYKEGKMPDRQGWVVTNSVRHMLPGSNLVNGADKEDDPALKVFGGYSGSAMNNSLKLSDSHEFWERCRTVRRSIAFSFRASIQRLKLINYTYRHKSLWRAVNRNTDLSKLSRAYSVEVANLGAWKYPGADMSAGEGDERMRIAYFAGLVNASFDGARGLFTLGVLTLGGNMSLSVGYDSKAVSEKDADIFVQAFKRGMEKLRETEGKITVLDVRSS